MSQGSQLKKRATYRYRVVRWVREEYEVESAEPLDSDTAYIRANDPNSVTVEKYTVQQVAP